MKHKEILKYTLLPISLLLAMTCCTQKEEGKQAVSIAKPSVSVTAITRGEMHKTKEFNIYSVYQNKESIRAPISGYIQSMLASPGGNVRKGERLVLLQTQEARALANTHLNNDSLIGFEGTVKVSAPKSGVVNIINYQEGAFVQQGEQLMEIIALSSITFIMNVPYEDILSVNKGSKAILHLPDNQNIMSTVGNRLPVVNTATQVQSFILHPDSSFYIPENLNAVAKVIVGQQPDVQRIEKQAVLTNETQTTFWIMKMINDSTAVRVDIKKGLESEELVEIKSPLFGLNDKILLNGQYGLPDTAYVNIMPR